MHKSCLLSHLSSLLLKLFNFREARKDIPDLLNILSILNARVGTVAVVSMASECQQSSRHGAVPASRGEDGHSVSWHNRISACFLFQFMVFIPLSQPRLSSSDLASLVFVLHCMVMLFWIFLPTFPISLASCQRVLARRFAAICKRTSGYELICRNPPHQHLQYIYIFS